MRGWFAIDRTEMEKWFRLAQWNDVPLSIVLVFVIHHAWSRSAEENAMLRRQLLTLSSSPVRPMGSAS